ncbi:hypothetical protein [Rhodoflexus caldus]|uniref:hypothetical protein n=1 Tax=Rhodoflexus caldus TaxID=2891236 RepID=UPI00202A32D8|nr:hypothetical protein [Rhodoflexus caldus]
MKELSMGVGLVSLSYLLVLWTIYRGRASWRLLRRRVTVFNKLIQCAVSRYLLPSKYAQMVAAEVCKLKIA